MQFLFLVGLLVVASLGAAPALGGWVPPWITPSSYPNFQIRGRSNKDYPGRQDLSNNGWVPPWDTTSSYPHPQIGGRIYKGYGRRQDLSRPNDGWWPGHLFPPPPTPPPTPPHFHSRHRINEDDGFRLRNKDRSWTADRPWQNSWEDDRSYSRRTLPWIHRRHHHHPNDDPEGDNIDYAPWNH